MNCGMQNGAAFGTGQSSLICKSCFAMIFTSTQTNQQEPNKQLKVASYVSKGNKNKELLSQGHFNYHLAKCNQRNKGGKPGRY